LKKAIIMTIRQKVKSFNGNCCAPLIVLLFMVSIYPLIVIPNSYDYFYLPRYIILLILASVSIPLLFRNKSRLINPIFIPLSLFMVFAFISTILSKDSETAWFGLYLVKTIHIAGQTSNGIIIDTFRFTGYITYISCVILLLLAYQNGKDEKLINGLIICAAIVGGIAILQHLGYNIVPHEAVREGTTSYSTIGNSNFLATYAVFILPAAIIKYFKTMKIKWVICSGFIYAALLVSTTRGGYISFFIIFIIIIVYCFKNKEYLKSLKVILFSLLLVTIILAPTRDWLIVKRALSIPQNIFSGIQLQDMSGSCRMYIWKQVLNILPKHWAFGLGFDNLINQGFRLGNGVIDKAHNIYLDMAISVGVFALMSFLVFISNFLKRWRTIDGFMFFTMILTYLIQGFVNIDVVMVMPIFWIVLGLSLSNIENEKTN